MAISLAQAQVHGGTVSGSTVHLALGSATTTGNTIVVAACVNNSSAQVTVSSIAISTGSATFSRIVNQAGTNAYATPEIWGAANITGGAAPTITVTASGTMTSADLVIMELAGMPSSLTSDGTAAGNSGTSASPTTAAITTSGSNDIIMPMCSPSHSCTNAATPFNTNFIQVAPIAMGFSYLIATTPQSALTCVFTQNVNDTFATVICALQGQSSNVTPTLTGTIGVTSPGVAVSYEYTIAGHALVSGSVKVTLQAAMTGTIGLSGTLGMSLQETLAGTTALSATQHQLTSIATTNLSGVSLVSGTVSPGYNLALSGYFTVSGTTTAFAGFSLVGAIGVTGTVVPSNLLPLSGAITISGTVMINLSPVYVVATGFINVTGVLSGTGLVTSNRGPGFEIYIFTTAT